MSELVTTRIREAATRQDLATLGFVEAKGNVALLGPPGVGKTMLAVGLAIATCQAGFSIYFTTLDDMVRQLREAETTGRFAKKLQTYLKASVLVLARSATCPCPDRRPRWSSSSSAAATSGAA
jgi:DNA replication protein DnaC